MKKNLWKPLSFVLTLALLLALRVLPGGLAFADGRAVSEPAEAVEETSAQPSSDALKEESEAEISTEQGEDQYISDEAVPIDGVGEEIPTERDEDQNDLIESVTHSALDEEIPDEEQSGLIKVVTPGGVEITIILDQSFSGAEGEILIEKDEDQSELFKIVTPDDKITTCSSLILTGGIRYDYSLELDAQTDNPNWVSIRGSDGEIFDITLSDANIIVPNPAQGVNYQDARAALSMAGDATLNLNLIGENTLISGFFRAGLELSEGSSLSIDSSDPDSVLIVFGGRYAAGIGSKYAYIDNDRVHFFGDITIKNSAVYSVARMEGAGIGTGSSTNDYTYGETEYPDGSQSMGDITIINSAVMGRGGSGDHNRMTMGGGAGIGAGFTESGASQRVGNITIIDSQVSADTGDRSDGAGIGAGSLFGGHVSIGDITVSGDSIVNSTAGGDEATAYGRGYGAGIGVGAIGCWDYLEEESKAVIGDITLSGAVVHAGGGQGTPGIGVGYVNTRVPVTVNIGTIRLESGVITCTGGDNMFSIDTAAVPGIGFGSVDHYDAGRVSAAIEAIEINGGFVTVEGDHVYGDEADRLYVSNIGSRNENSSTVSLSIGAVIMNGGSVLVSSINPRPVNAAGVPVYRVTVPAVYDEDGLSRDITAPVAGLTEYIAKTVSDKGEHGRNLPSDAAAYIYLPEGTHKDIEIGDFDKNIAIVTEPSLAEEHNNRVLSPTLSSKELIVSPSSASMLFDSSLPLSASWSDADSPEDFDSSLYYDYSEYYPDDTIETIADRIRWEISPAGIAELSSASGQTIAVVSGNVRGSVSVSAILFDDIASSNLTVTPIPPEITTSAIADGRVNQPYNQILEAKGEAPIDWEITSGTLPGGLTLRSLTTTNGAISGTPTTAGSFEFDVTAKNINGSSEPKSFTITIAARSSGGSGGGGGSSSSYYTVNATASSGGSISESGEVRVLQGTTKAFTFKPDTGWKIKDVLVDGKSVGALASYTFTNVIANHTIHVTFEAVIVTTPAGMLFTDIEDHWAKDAILYVVGLGLLKGVSETQFAPDALVDRASFITTLGRYAKVSDGAASPGAFKDADYNAYYASHLVWAVENGIVNSVGVEFYPNESITREQAAVIIVRYMRSLGMDMNVSGATGFSDLTWESDWSREEILLVQKYGVMKGQLNNGTLRFNPLAPISRGELAQIWANLYGILNANGSSGAAISTDGGVFADTANHWAKDAILYVVDLGLLKGVSETQFAPDALVDRASFITTLGRYAKVSDGAVSPGAFKDVDYNAYYASHLAWAVENGIVDNAAGVGFSPNENITREQVAVMIIRYMESLGMDMNVSGAAGFSDLTQENDWSREEILLAQKYGVMKGQLDNGMLSFNPLAPISRGELAQIWTNLYGILADK
ncbi:MAG: S-layer homology domain-containing protein [Clostridiales Family XIII bacterium]|nr:S-layer homology domain-containing protein [Clostridiales Family XIII bacterium]